MFKSIQPKPIQNISSDIANDILNKRDENIIFTEHDIAAIKNIILKHKLKYIDPIDKFSYGGITLECYNLHLNIVVHKLRDDYLLLYLIEFGNRPTHTHYVVDEPYKIIEIVEKKQKNREKLDESLSWLNDIKFNHIK